MCGRWSPLEAFYSPGRVSCWPESPFGSWAAASPAGPAAWLEFGCSCRLLSYRLAVPFSPLCRCLLCSHWPPYRGRGSLVEMPCASGRNQWAAGIDVGTANWAWLWWAGTFTRVVRSGGRCLALESRPGGPSAGSMSVVYGLNPAQEPRDPELTVVERNAHLSLLLGLRECDPRLRRRCGQATSGHEAGPGCASLQPCHELCKNADCVPSASAPCVKRPPWRHSHGWATWMRQTLGCLLNERRKWKDHPFSRPRSSSLWSSTFPQKRARELRTIQRRHSCQLAQGKGGQRLKREQGGPSFGAEGAPWAGKAAGPSGGGARPHQHGAARGGHV